MTGTTSAEHDLRNWAAICRCCISIWSFTTS